VCPYCERLERVKLGTESFKDIASQVVPVRIEIGKGGELLKRWQVHVFPALRVLNAQGALVYTVDSQNLLRIEQEVVIAKKVEADFQKVLKTANLADPAVREDFVGRHLGRTDVDSGLALYRGYARDEKSDARLRSLERVARALISRGRLDEANAIVSDAEPVFTGLDALARLDQIKLETCKYRLEHAYLERKKDLCWKILDEIAERFPESEIAKHKDEHRKWIETHDPQITDRGE
jgi:hypothetical protein